MSVQDRISALKKRHHELDTAIEEENRRPHPDDTHIADLKRQKLKIKDEIAALG